MTMLEIAFSADGWKILEALTKLTTAKIKELNRPESAIPEQGLSGCKIKSLEIRFDP